MMMMWRTWGREEAKKAEKETKKHGNNTKSSLRLSLVLGCAKVCLASYALTACIYVFLTAARWAHSARAKFSDNLPP
jgi:hypothetical protein